MEKRLAFYQLACCIFTATFLIQCILFSKIEIFKNLPWQTKVLKSAKNFSNWSPTITSRSIISTSTIKVYQGFNNINISKSAKKVSNLTPQSIISTSNVKVYRGFNNVDISESAEKFSNWMSAITPQSITPRYMTILFGATCTGGRLSNKLFEFVSLYAISRTLNRTPYANENDTCIRREFKFMESIFPKLVRQIQLKNTHIIPQQGVELKECNRRKSRYLRCKYKEVDSLKSVNSSSIIINDWYLHSFKIFHQYRENILELLSFTNEDIASASQISREIFANDSSHKICVHTRRGDFLNLIRTHPPSTANFTIASVLYVRQKLNSVGKEATVALLGDDRSWLKSLFPNETNWIRVPKMTGRPSADYAFFARHCNSIILTASVSTFGFWSAYLSSAETVYFSMEFSMVGPWKVRENVDIFFPSEWKALQLVQANQTNFIIEIDRNAKQ